MQEGSLRTPTMTLVSSMPRIMVPKSRVTVWIFTVELLGALIATSGKNMNICRGSMAMMMLLVCLPERK